MAAKVVLKAMKCPTCGGELKAENNSKLITCVYCGNLIQPVTEASPAADGGPLSQSSGKVRIEGIKTPSSALAYIEQLFEDYDWEAFSYAHSLSIPEIDKLADSMKVSSADDKNTWILCFKAEYVPFLHKIEGMRRLLGLVITEYKKDSLDAYSRFDAYRRISDVIATRKDSIIKNLTKMADNAQRYGADIEEVSELKARIGELKDRSQIVVYRHIEDIPEIKSFIEAKNNAILQELAAEGIDARGEYNRALSLIQNKKYVNALTVLSSLRGYADTDKLIEQLDRYFVISDVLEIGGKLYYFTKGAMETTLDLHDTADGKISDKVLIKDIVKVVTNYADILYYIGKGRNLYKYDFSANKATKILTGGVSEKNIYADSETVYLFSSNSEEEWRFDLTTLKPSTGKVESLIANIRKILHFDGDKLVYTIAGDAIKLFDVRTRTVTSLGDSNVNVEGYINDNVIYTVDTPNKENRNLYIQRLGPDTTPFLVEKNIYGFCDVISDKLFYYVGNKSNRVLISISIDGTERRQWPRLISEVLFEQGGWVYFIRREGYNSILCKARPDGEKFSIIASDIESFIELKNGYLYYINSDSELMRVRMDGSNRYKICGGVNEVLSVKDDRIVFVSVDDIGYTNDTEMSSVKAVRSVYAVDFTGRGRIKLAYDVKSVKKYDDNTVYYISAERSKGEDNYEVQKSDVLYSLDIESNTSEKLLTLKREESSNMSAFKIMMILAGLFCLVSMVSFCAEALAFAVLSFLAMLVCIAIGLVSRFDVIKKLTDLIK